jgi:hypothetical protein
LFLIFLFLFPRPLFFYLHSLSLWFVI